MGLTDEEVAKGCERGFKSVLGPDGEEKIRELAYERIRRRALEAAFVTFVCTLPPWTWLSWVGFFADLLFFQLRVFKVSQELVVLINGREGCEDNVFNFKSLWTITAKIGGVALKNKLFNLVKDGAGKVANYVTPRAARTFRAPLRMKLRPIAVQVAKRPLVVQVAKWVSVTTSLDFLNTVVSVILSAAVTAVAALVSLILFYFTFRGWLRKELPEQPRESGSLAQEEA